VARMAGMPPSLIERANSILHHLESKHVEVDDPDNKEIKSAKEKVKSLSRPEFQLSIFDAHTEIFEEIRKLLEDMDINRLTPVEALLKLQEIKNMLK
jgi:DNA mismatch repair protein MutS